MLILAWALAVVLVTALAGILALVALSPTRAMLAAWFLLTGEDM